MARDDAQFESEILAIEKQIEVLAIGDDPAKKAELARLAAQRDKLRREIFSSLNPWQKALVARHVCPHDRRAVDVCITPKGLALLGDIDAQQADFERTFTTLTPAEADTLSNLLDKMRG